MAPKFDHTASRLGTKEYWEEHYTREILNFEETGSEGEIWFGEQSERKIVKFVTDNFKNKHVTKFVELGTGNGSLLRRLHDKGFTQLCGIDYSEKALQLAQKTCEVALLECENDNDTIFKFEKVDLTAPESILNTSLHNLFDCVIDKGTWDAISLSFPDGDVEAAEQGLQNYRRSIVDLFHKQNKNSKFFIIVSCNFTREELCRMFECQSLRFDQVFSASNLLMFGGQVGTTFTGVVFRLIE